jgi:DNA-binding Xre family transcriptional regulator
MSGKLRNRLFLLISEKERQLGRRITHTEIAEETGVTIQLVGRWVKNDVTQYSGEIIEKLCDYFHCEVGDLLYIDRNSS